MTGTTASFTFFDARHRARILRVLALSVPDPLVAAAAVDEAMASAQRHWGEVRTLRNPAGWVYRVGRAVAARPANTD